MKFYSLLCIIFQFYKGTSIKIKPKLKRNILNFGLGINYKYEGMLAHPFDRFYVVTKFILPMIGDLKFLILILLILVHTQKINLPKTTESRKYIKLKAFCNKIKPFLTFYKRLINSYNNTDA